MYDLNDPLPDPPAYRPTWADRLAQWVYPRRGALLALAVVLVVEVRTAELRKLIRGKGRSWD